MCPVTLKAPPPYAPHPSMAQPVHGPMNDPFFTDPIFPGAMPRPVHAVQMRKREADLMSAALAMPRQTFTVSGFVSTRGKAPSSPAPEKGLWQAMGQCASTWNALWRAPSAAKSARETTSPTVLVHTVLVTLVQALEQERNKAQADINRMTAELPWAARRAGRRVLQVVLPIALGVAVTLAVVKLPVLACLLGLMTAAVSWLVLLDDDYEGKPIELPTTPKHANKLRHPRLALEQATREHAVFLAAHNKLLMLLGQAANQNEKAATMALKGAKSSFEHALSELDKQIQPLQGNLKSALLRVPITHWAWASGALFAAAHGARLVGIPMADALCGVAGNVMSLPGMAVMAACGQTAQNVAGKLDHNQRAADHALQLLQTERAAWAWVAHIAQEACDAVRAVPHMSIV